MKKLYAIMLVFAMLLPGLIIMSPGAVADTGLLYENFEDGVANGWTLLKSGPGAVMSVSGTAKYSGNYGLYFSSYQSGDQASYSCPANIPIGTPYYISFWFKSAVPTASDNGNLIFSDGLGPRLNLYNNGQLRYVNATGENVALFTPSNSWMFVNISVAGNHQTYDLNFGLNSYYNLESYGSGDTTALEGSGSGANSITVYFDNWSVVTLPASGIIPTEWSNDRIMAFVANWSVIIISIVTSIIGLRWNIGLLSVFGAIVYILAVPVMWTGESLNYITILAGALFHTGLLYKKFF
jgi:hypothetical protein